MNCKAVLPERNWVYDFDDGRVLWDGGHIELTPQEAAIFGLLDKAYPHKVNNRKMINALYPSFMPECDLPDNPTGNIHVQASHIRHKLMNAHAPFRVPFGDSFGLWLEIPSKGE